MLELHDFSVKIHRKEIVHPMDITLQNGIHGLLGPNGAGKTTWMRGVLQLYPGNQKHVTFDGAPVHPGQVGYLPQQYGLFPQMTVRESLRYFGNLKQIPSSQLEEEISRCNALVNLEDKKDEKMRKLSGGMVRRVGIAQALLGSPQIVILDEPTAGLDPEERLRIKNLIREIKKDRLIVISTHIVDDIEFLCDYVEIMREGSILFADTCDALCRQAEGKVYRIPRGETALPAGYLVKEYEQEGSCYMRYLTADPVSYEALEPGIEDGYLCVLKNI